MKIPHIKEMGTVNTMNNGDMEGTKRERLGSCSQEISFDINWKNCHENIDKLVPIPENSEFMFHKDFYPKPELPLKHVNFSFCLILLYI